MEAKYIATIIIVVLFLLLVGSSMSSKSMAEVQSEIDCHLPAPAVPSLEVAHHAHGVYVLTAAGRLEVVPKRETVQWIAKKILVLEEGYRGLVYKDGDEYAIGYGRQVSKYTPSTDRETEMDYLEHRISYIHSLLSENERGRFDGYGNLTPSQQAVIISMAYQMGITGVMHFDKMWKDIAKGANPAAEALDSLWAEQTTGRAIRHVAVLHQGTYKEAYDFGEGE